MAGGKEPAALVPDGKLLPAKREAELWQETSSWEMMIWGRARASIRHHSSGCVPKVSVVL